MLGGGDSTIQHGQHFYYKQSMHLHQYTTNQPTSISLFSFKPFQIIGIVILFEEARYRAGECGRGKEERGREGVTKPLSVQEGEDGGKKEQEEKEEFYKSLSP